MKQKHQAETRQTVCPLDCADTCSLEVAVEGDTLSSVRGGKANPFTRGKLCAKVVNSFPAQVHGDLRIKTPLLRQDSLGGRNFQPISWEQALDTILERFNESPQHWGSQAIAPLCYSGPMGVLAGRSLDKRFFHLLGASLVDSLTLCARTSSAARDTAFGVAGRIAFAACAQPNPHTTGDNRATPRTLHWKPHTS